jgi:hypothetical protein
MTGKGRWDRCDADFIHGKDIDAGTYPEERVLTLDPATDTYVHRLPGGASSPHALGGDQHTPSTLAELNAKLSDAARAERGRVAAGNASRLVRWIVACCKV